MGRSTKTQRWIWFSLVLMGAWALATGIAAASPLLVFGGFESGDQVSGHAHIVGLNAASYIPWESVTDQWRLDQLRAQGSRPILAHPYDGSYTAADIVAMHNVTGMEVLYKDNMDFSNKWDQVLAAGGRVWAFGVDDSHDQLLTGGTAFIVVRAPALTESAILTAIDNGDFFASKGPWFSDIGLTTTKKSQSVFATSVDPSTFTFITKAGAVSTANHVTSARYTVRLQDGYVRVRIVRDSDALQATSQPFFVSSRGVASNPYAGGGMWYKGDTHFHTTATDGQMSPADCLDWYSSHGYSFVSPADHNSITTDFTRPAVTNASLDVPAFSPNGDGLADRVTFGYATQESALTKIYIYDAGGTLVKTQGSWIAADAGPQAYTWDGKILDPVTGVSGYAPSGAYRMQARVKDAVGNVGFGTATVVVNRTIASMKVSPAAFSPNGDSSKDTTVLTYELGLLATVHVTVLDGAGNEVRDLVASEAQAAGTICVTWDGADESGAAAGDGVYTMAVTATNDLGTVQAAKAVTIDTVKPVLSALTIDPATLALPALTTVGFSADEAGWLTVSVVDANNSKVKSYSQAVTIGSNSFTWDGVSTDGVTALPGVYTFKLFLKDNAGNATSPSMFTVKVTIQ